MLKMGFNFIVMLLPLYCALLSAGDFCSDARSEAKACPAGWIRYKDQKCLKLFWEELAHGDAQAVCELNDSVLASVHGNEEREFLLSILLKKNPKSEGMRHVWLGGRYAETKLFWFDYSLFDVVTWWPGHPAWAGQPPLAGRCVRLVTGSDYLKTHPEHWGKVGTDDCITSKFSFFCQKYQTDTNPKAQRAIPAARLHISMA